jgi:hypothetical protein
MIKQVRREKIAKKTRELKRERRGEVLRRTIRRSNNLQGNTVACFDAHE